MIHWVVWYADATTFTNLDGEPDEAPRDDVLCIAAYSQEHGRMIWHAEDFYIWETQWPPGEWISVDGDGLSDYLDRPGNYKVRLRGRHVPPRVFWHVYAMANDDPRLPPRSGYDPRERRP